MLMWCGWQLLLTSGKETSALSRGAAEKEEAADFDIADDSGGDKTTHTAGSEATEGNEEQKRRSKLQGPGSTTQPGGTGSHEMGGEED